MHDPEPPDLPEPIRTGFVEPAGPAFQQLVELMATLRAPGGCPWDREQTHESLRPFLVEETYEVLDAIDMGNAASLREELGDLLLQVIFHANIAFEEDDFTLADVCDDLRSKLIRRHPHVFGDVEVADAAEVRGNWEQIKAAEKGRSGPFDDIPAAMPALARSAKVQRRTSSSWPLDARRAVFEEEVDELRYELDQDEPDPERVAEELGDVLFTAAALGAGFDIDPEAALRGTLGRVERIYGVLHRMATDDGTDPESLSAEAWSEYWERAKKEVGP